MGHVTVSAPRSSPVLLLLAVSNAKLDVIIQLADTNADADFSHLCSSYACIVQHTGVVARLCSYSADMLRRNLNEAPDSVHSEEKTHKEKAFGGSLGTDKQV